MTSHEWELHETKVSNLFNKWQTSTRDLFAFPANKCSTYCIRSGIGLHLQDNELILHWSGQINYTSPLYHKYLPHVLHKIRRERATVILIAPF